MKLLKSIVLGSMALVLLSTMGLAGNYDWMRDFNIRAEADPLDFRARLEARFKIDDLEIDAVFDTADEPADAYMLCRLGEMADEPIDHVIDKYKDRKGQGWGNLAKSLGIKPGSPEFHALKQSQDLYDDPATGKGKGKGKHKDKGKKKK